MRVRLELLDVILEPVADRPGRPGRRWHLGARRILRGPSASRCPYAGSTNDALLAAYAPDGTRLWTSDVAVSYGAAAPAIADLDGDGSAEVVVRRSVFVADGTHRWTDYASEGWDARVPAGAYSIAAGLPCDRLYGHTYGMKTTLVLKEEVVREAKKRAAEMGISLSELTERSLRDALADRPPARRRRIVLPTSGHGLPGYDHDVVSIKALETEDDGER